MSQANSARTVLKFLAETYAVFKQAKPLAIGINKQLAELHPDLDAKALKSALFHHTRSVAYLKAVSKAEHRFGLDGEPVAPLLEEQRQYAVEQLKALSKKRNEAIQAEQQKKADELKAQKLNDLVAKFGKH